MFISKFRTLQQFKVVSVNICLSWLTKMNKHGNNVFLMLVNQGRLQDFLSEGTYSFFVFVCCFFFWRGVGGWVLDVMVK